MIIIVASLILSFIHSAYTIREIIVDDHNCCFSYFKFYSLRIHHTWPVLCAYLEQLNIPYITS